LQEIKPDSEKIVSVANAVANYLEFNSGWIDDDEMRDQILTYYIPLALWLEH